MSWLVEPKNGEYWHVGLRDLAGNAYTRNTGVPIQPIRPEGCRGRAYSRLVESCKKQAFALGCLWQESLRGECTSKEFAAQLQAILSKLCKLLCPCSVSAFAANWLWEKCWAQQLIGCTLFMCCDTWASFLAHLGSAANTMVARIKPAQVRRYLAAQLTAGASRTVYNARLDHLRAGFRRAVELGYAPANPASVVKRLKTKTCRVRALTVAQINALLEAAAALGELGEEWVTAILLGALGSLATPAAYLVRRQQVVLPEGARGHLLVPGKPGCDPLIVPLPVELEAHLRSVLAKPPHDPEAYLCQTLARRSRSSRARGFRQLLREAEILGDKETQRGNYCFTSLQAAFITYLRLAKVSPKAISRLLGAGSTKTVARLDDSADPELVGAIGTLPNFLELGEQETTTT